uniref:RING-type E3 ubiquitin transferase n=1 Tax=Grammatophora oceanica TaxID=210454 RepID=A0A7S1YM11_9STRA|mmetsp:Transcript_5642/g.7884  ORF Transcript_5642/g.7884 Transcript_5642/m.7884 type:complete len:317 (+) Transcript_5642:56-1006(+)
MAPTNNNSDAANAAAGAEQVFHPLSRYQEPHLDAHLTLFDLHRCPRAKAKDSDSFRLSIPLKTLNEEFTCPICLGYMRKTSMVMECLHRFCEECIQKCLRIGKKECPSCRIKIPTRRSLRPDTKFDAIVSCILGPLEELEKEEEREAERAKEKHKLYAATRKRGMMDQASSVAAQRGRGKKAARTTAATANASAADGDEAKEDDEEVVLERRSTAQPIEMEPSPLVAIELRRHPQEHRVERIMRPLLKVHGNMTIGILKKFISSKLSYDRQPLDFQITIRGGGEAVELEDTLPIGDIRWFKQPPDPVTVLHYRLSP